LRHTATKTVGVFLVHGNLTTDGVVGTVTGGGGIVFGVTGDGGITAGLPVGGGIVAGVTGGGGIVGVTGGGGIVRSVTIVTYFSEFFCIYSYMYISFL
jgi:hypothetical protein